MRRHGIQSVQDLVQSEVDALPPDELRNLYQTAIDWYRPRDAYEAVMERER
jgi:hypothetical protein